MMQRLHRYRSLRHVN